MLGTTITVLAFAAAVFAIGWLWKVNKLVSDLGRRVLETQDIHRVIEAAGKVESFDSRVAGNEQKASENQNQFAEYKTKLDELATRLGSFEQLAKKNETCVADIIPAIKALTDDIRTIRKFQTATEKVHNLMLSAFSDMQAIVSSDEGLGTPEADNLHAASEAIEEWWQGRVDDVRMSESHQEQS